MTDPERERAGGPGNGERVALLLSGAAARGPYQAGALAELLPALVAEDHRPVVLLGTSSGAVTAALLAQFADQPPADAGQSVVDTWVGFGDVFRNPLTSPKPALPILARLLGGDLADRFVPPVQALLDTAPLRERAHTVFDPRRVAANIAAGSVETLAVAATACPSGGSAARSSLFVQGAQPRRAVRGHAVDVVADAVTVDHVLASAAIPILFPPVRIPGRPGWFIDGGVRLNTPFDAALAMGVDRIVVISGHSVVPPAAPPPQADTPPDLAAAAAISLRAVLTDALSDDLESLRRKNRRAAGGAGYQQVRHLVVAPEDGELARLAAGTFGPCGPSDPYWAIGRLLDSLGSGTGRDELLSLIFFDPAYAQQQVDLGRRHARAALGAGWQT
ncbi:MAG TPA: patatin-like phospholipase family protein [Pseudonocardia sp.]|nr:patatin-like phospholipase family protein [Pseudonocardia sp.]